MSSDATEINGEATLRVVPYPQDTNPSGDIFGGWIMSHVDIAGSIEAFRRAKRRVGTVAVNAFAFHKPVFVGDVVSFYAKVDKVGTTSITVSVVVIAERSWKDAATMGQKIKVTEAVLTYVAIDENRRPQPVPK